ncbi:MAG TPA: choice-of-anchor J domain-containing protein [Flavobacteriaceae bacterium]|nr:choice-of-anchor J domain-containing protein [Flavobacteriaceae bacterium]
MKKITLLAASLLLSFGMNAQIFYDDFDDGDITDWTQIDYDGDGQEFFPYNPTGASSPMVASASWTSTEGPLTPDNFFVSPAIDVTGASGLELSYMAGGQDPSYSAENYTVYVSTGNQVDDFLNTSISVSFTENLGDDPDAAGSLVPRTLDASELDGATTVYIAIRHHGVSDQFYIIFDDVQLDGNLSAADHEISGFSRVYSAQSKNLTIAATENFSSISMFNVLGQQVLSRNLSSNNEVINLSNMKDGVYIANVTAGGNTTTFKIVKR